MQIFSDKDITIELQRAFRQVISKFDSFVQGGSGWWLKRCEQFELTTSKYPYFRGGCNAAPKLPESVLKSRSCIAVKTDQSDMCFLYSVAAAVLRLKKNPQRALKRYRAFISDLPQIKKFIQFPVGVPQIRKFEGLAQISVNVYSWAKPSVVPFYITDRKDLSTHVNLFLYENHYYAIRSMSALVSRHTPKVRRAKIFVCNYCLCYFTSQEKLSFHLEICKKNKQRLSFPSGEKVRFHKFKKLVPVPFVIYADFESLCTPYTDRGVSGKLISKSRHIPISSCAITVCYPNPEFSSEIFLHTGTDCVRTLLTHLESEFDRIMNILETVNTPINFTSADEKRFLAAKRCFMCRSKFDSSLDKCRDHCHLSGKYRFALCNTCNLIHAKSHREVYVFFHGLSNYDSHFIVRELHRYHGASLNVIQKTGEKYLTFSIGDLHFRDSFSFLPESLSTLIRNLKDKSSSSFKILHQYVSSSAKRDLLKQKGVFPYSYLTSEEVLDETSLPPIEKFYNELTECHISQDEYEFAKRVWREFKCNTIRDYMEVYLQSDVLCLADVMENFRSQCFRDYDLDPVYYFSAPHYTFDAFFRFSSAQVELLSDPNMYLFFSKGVRGGVSMISKRLSVANHKYLPDYDPSLPSKYILYLDCTNLYGKAMQQFLPRGNFRWMDDNELDETFIMSLAEDSGQGCVLDVTFLYPPCTHCEHSDLPLAPEKATVSYDQLSPYSRHLCDKFKLKHSLRSSKLLTTLRDKHRYIVHYRAFQLYVQLGLKVAHIHHGIMFDQSPYMKDYVDLNSKKRSEATNNFDSNFFKLMVNSLYGKSLQRPDNKTKTHLVTNSKYCQRLVAKPTFKSLTPIHSKLVGINMKYPVISIEKPSYIGMCILDHAKTVMYHFHYNVIRKFYGDRCSLLFTDTDSLMYEIYTDDVYEDLSRFASYFDFSNYPSDHFLHSKDRAKIPGTFKDETASKPIKAFVGLKSKMYAFVMAEGKEIKAAKGVKKSVIHNCLKFENYVNCLNSKHCMEHKFRNITSKHHKVHTFYQAKKTLSPFDDKRWVCDDGVTTLAHGHFLIP